MTETWSADKLSVMWQSAPKRILQRAEPAPAPPEPRVKPVWRTRLPTASGSDVPGGGVIDDAVSGGAGRSDDAETLGLQIRSLASEIAAKTCEWLHLIARFDRTRGWSGIGITSCASWLAWTCSISPATAREYVRVARAMTALPLIDAAFAAGRLSYSKVRVMVKVAADIDEKTLLDQARVQTVRQLERTVRAFRRGDGQRQEGERRASWYWDDDGMLVLSARLPADEGALLVTALERVADELRAENNNAENNNAENNNAENNSHGTAADPAPPSALIGVDPLQAARADMLVGLAHRSLAAGPTDSSGDDRHLVVVHIDADQSAGATPALPGPRCHIENGPGLDHRTAARIACDAAIVHVVHLSGAGEPLVLGRKTRRISPAQRRALRIRDEGCVFPGCHRRTHLDAHHILPWSLGGRTDLDNLVLLCRFHHFLVHEGGYVVTATSETSPSGGSDAIAESTRGVSRRWVFRDPCGDAVPEVPELPGREAAALGMPPAAIYPIDPAALLPGWRGEPFHLSETVGVFACAPKGGT